MIKLEIIESYYDEQVGQYTFYKDNLFIGRALSSDIPTRSDQTYQNHLFIEIMNNELTVYKDKECDHIHINQKIVTSFKKIKSGDVISIPGLSFKLLAFEHESQQTKTKKEKRELIRSKYPHLETLLQSLEQKR